MLVCTDHIGIGVNFSGFELNIYVSSILKSTHIGFCSVECEGLTHSPEKIVKTNILLVYLY